MAPDASSSPQKPMRGATRVLSEILDSLGGDQDSTEKDPTAKLGEVVDRLDDRAFGLLLLLLALPCCIPFVWGIPQIVALPMLALAGQMAMGRHHPWLPRTLHERPFSVPAFQKVVTRSARYVGWIERFATPRLRPVTSHLATRLVGALLLIPTASILLPVPSTNTIPGIGVAIASLGLIERDGILVIIGLLIGFIWVGLLVFLGHEATQLIKDWLAARF